MADILLEREILEGDELRRLLEETRAETGAGLPLGETMPTAQEPP
jgi:hypothetical protein